MGLPLTVAGGLRGRDGDAGLALAVAAPGLDVAVELQPLRLLRDERAGLLRRGVLEAQGVLLAARLLHELELLLAQALDVRRGDVGGGVVGLHLLLEVAPRRFVADQP